MKYVAIIGSFQKENNYQLVQELISLFEKEGLIVTSPTGAIVTDKREGFVVFDSDNHALSNEKIQFDTLAKIFSAHAVYVANLDGYIGRTTCYEIGRIIEKKIPIYFFCQPKDLPICLTNEFIVPPEQFVDIIKKSEQISLDLNCSSCEKIKICTGEANA